VRRAAGTLPAVVLLLLHFLVDRSQDDAALVDASKRLQAKKQPIVNVKATAKGKGRSRSGKGGGRRSGGGGGGGGSAEFMGGETGAAAGAGDAVGEGASSEVGATMGAMGAAGERGEVKAAVKADDVEAAEEEERERFDMLLDGVATDARVFRTRSARAGDPTLGFACYRAAIPHAAHEPVSIVRFEPVVTRPEAGPPPLVPSLCHHSVPMCPFPSCDLSPS
jgi:hypothetical protein